MGLTVNGNVVIQNYIETGAKVEHKYYGTVNQGVGKEEMKELEDEPLALNTIIARVAQQVQSSRMWFAVFKGFLESGKARQKDYAGFKKKIEEGATTELPYPISASELSEMDSLSFSKPIEDWNIESAPIKRAKEFYAYQDLAILARELTKKMKTEE